MGKPDAEKIASIMLEEGESAVVVSLDSVDSTNSEARRRVQNGERLPLVVTADSQSAGRGRIGRTFFSPPGTGVYESVVLDAGRDVISALTVTAAAAVSVCRAIVRTAGLEPEIKWVNDIYLNGGKVCGILAESFPYPGGTAVVIGAGINVSTVNFPEEIRNTAASLGTLREREKLAALTASGIISLARLGTEAYIEEYRNRSMVVGNSIMYGPAGGVMREAEAVGIDDQCGLVIRLPDGSTVSLRSGEISVRVKKQQ